MIIIIVIISQSNEEEIAPSTIFATASILEGSTYINGSPQNTFVPGVLDLAEKHNVFVVGDDFKSGENLFCVLQCFVSCFFVCKVVLVCP